MSFKINIIEGHDPSSYFWFRPVKIHNVEKIMWTDVEELKEEFSIEEEDIYCFLSFFFFKYFDKEYIYNKNRYDGDFCNYIEGFEWNLTHNFFSYETLEKMLCEIEMVTKLLKKDYMNEKLKPIKERFSIYYMCDQESSEYREETPENIEKHKDVVIDFYQRFVKRMRKMMINNSNTDIISIMGP